MFARDQALVLYESETQMRQDKTVPLVQAAVRLHLSYRAALDLVLCGKLRGYQDANRRWLVDRDDLERECSERLARERTERGQAVTAAQT